MAAVSIIIPAFNYGAFLPATLESILQQQYQDWECIVIDDGSTDNTAEVVASFSKRDGRILYIYQANSGVAQARNKGLTLTKGAYIQFLDADDLIEPRKLLCHAQYLDDHPDVDIVYGSVRYFRTEYPEEQRYSFLVIDAETRSLSQTDAPWMLEVSGSGKPILEALVKTNIMVVSAPLLRRGMVDRVGLFDWTVSPVEDWDYWFRCALHGAKFKYLDMEGTLSVIRLHTESASQNSPLMEAQIWKLRRKWRESASDQSLVRAIQQTLDGYDGHCAVRLIDAGYLEVGVQILKNAFRASPRWKESLKWLYCILVVRFAPKGAFHKIAYLPIRESLKLLFRIRM